MLERRTMPNNVHLSRGSSARYEPSAGKPVINARLAFCLKNTRERGEIYEIGCVAVKRRVGPREHRAAYSLNAKHQRS